jgi:EAL domain-containing protein (putative c-di-GMP-specific phosphodiesterase class I)
MLASLVKMTTELGILPLAEGVETIGEHQTCRELGFRLAQGYLYGKPAPSQLYQAVSAPLEPIYAGSHVGA